jgi:preprotein translocase subunit YajC
MITLAVLFSIAFILFIRRGMKRARQIKDQNDQIYIREIRRISNL